MIDSTGTVIRVTDGKILRPKYRKNGKYAMIQVNEKQYYLHHLLAEAFIPNPNGYKYVGFVDENPSNLTLENICWKEKPGSQTGRFHPCKLCGKQTYIKNEYCYKCKGKVDKKNQKMQEQRTELQGLDTSNLTEMEQTIIELRMKGHTYDQIGKEFGISRERVRQIIKKLTKGE